MDHRPRRGPVRGSPSGGGGTRTGGHRRGAMPCPGTAGTGALAWGAVVQWARRTVRRQRWARRARRHDGREGAQGGGGARRGGKERGRKEWQLSPRRRRTLRETRGRERREERSSWGGKRKNREREAEAKFIYVSLDSREKLEKSKRSNAKASPWCDNFFVPSVRRACVRAPTPYISIKMPLQVGRPGQVSLKTPLFADPHKRLLILYTQQIKKHIVITSQTQSFLPSPVEAPTPQESLTAG